MSTARSTAPARLHRDQHRRHLRAAARRRAPTGAGLPNRRAAASASTTSRPTRCSARSAPTGMFTETTPYAAELALFGVSKAASDHLVRAWHHTYGLPALVTNCSNNYGPYHFPEKLIPLMILSALRGRAACRSTARARTCATGSMSRTMPRRCRWYCASGRPGETYNIGGDSERAQHRGRARDLRAARRAAARQREPPARAS